MTKGTLLAVLLTTSATVVAEVSPYAPAQIIPASEKTAVGRERTPDAPGVSKKGPRRARMPFEQRKKEGKIPGLVTFSYGKTASGERTHVYRIMGQGGAVMDFTDYGAKPIRCYVPDPTGDLVNVIKAKANVIDCEKAGELAEVWKMTPIRRPGATGLVFEIPDGRAVSMKPPQTNDVAKSNNRTIEQSNNSRVTYWLDAENRFVAETAIPDTNAVKFAASFIAIPPFPSLTNETSVVLRPTTNVVQRLEWRLPVVK